MIHQNIIIVHPVPHLAQRAAQTRLHHIRTILRPQLQTLAQRTQVRRQQKYRHHITPQLPHQLLRPLPVNVKHHARSLPQRRLNRRPRRAIKIAEDLRRLHKPPRRTALLKLSQTQKIIVPPLLLIPAPRPRRRRHRKSQRRVITQKAARNRRLSAARRRRQHQDTSRAAATAQPAKTAPTHEVAKEHCQA